MVCLCHCEFSLVYLALMVVRSVAAALMVAAALIVAAVLMVVAALMLAGGYPTTLRPLMTTIMF